jgi:hypothetical protein
MISWKCLHKSSFKNHIEFEMWYLEGFLVMFDDQFFLVDGNEILENEQ